MPPCSASYVPGSARATASTGSCPARSSGCARTGCWSARVAGSALTPPTCWARSGSSPAPNWSPRPSGPRWNRLPESCPVGSLRCWTPDPTPDRHELRLKAEVEQQTDAWRPLPRPRWHQGHHLPARPLLRGPPDPLHRRRQDPHPARPGMARNVARLVGWYDCRPASPRADTRIHNLCEARGLSCTLSAESLDSMNHPVCLTRSTLPDREPAITNRGRSHLTSTRESHLTFCQLTPYPGGPHLRAALASVDREGAPPQRARPQRRIRARPGAVCSRLRSRRDRPGPRLSGLRRLLTRSS